MVTWGQERNAEFVPHMALANKFFGNQFLGNGVQQTKNSAQKIATEHADIVLKIEAQSAKLAALLRDAKTKQVPHINSISGVISKLLHDFFRLPAKISEVQAAERLAGNFNPQDWTALNFALSQTRTWAVQWPTVEQVIRNQIPPKRRKLYSKPKNPSGMAMSQTFISDGIVNELQRILNPNSQSEIAVDYGCFGDIALPQSIFLEHLHAAYRVLRAQGKTDTSRFIDVGCGGGIKVLSAAEYFDVSYGLEYDEGYAIAACDLAERTHSSNCRIIHGDGLIFEGYCDLDVIYFYRPMQQAELLSKLEDQITSTARPGTILIAPYMHFASRAKDLNCGKLAKHLYLANTSQADADVIRKKAEKVGAFVGKNLPLTPGAWDPIVDVSISKGYGLNVRHFIAN